MRKTAYQSMTPTFAVVQSRACTQRATTAAEPLRGKDASKSVSEKRPDVPIRIETHVQKQTVIPNQSTQANTCLYIGFQTSSDRANARHFRVRRTYDIKAT